MIGSKSSKCINALLDEGSTVTIINYKVVNELGIKGAYNNVSLKGIVEEILTMSNQKVTLKLRASNRIFELKNVLVVKNLGLPNQSLSEKISNLCFESTGIRVDPYEASPEMLIGQDCIELILTREFHQLQNTGLILSRCSLGWIIHGNVSGKSQSVVNSIEAVEQTDCLCSNKLDELNNLIKVYFEIDSLGVKYQFNMKSEQKLAIDILNKTSRYVNGVWEVGLLWNSDYKNLPDSRVTALNRLMFIEKKLDRNKEFANLYIKEIDRLIENKFAIKAQNSLVDGKQWYLPHFGVQNINKPGKVRVVFDAAAKTKNLSLNDLLLSGPDLLKPLLGVLMRFRQYKYAVIADIKDMFLKIKIREEDRNAQRFLWRGRDRLKEPEEYVMSSMLFGAKSSPCTALFIKNKNAEMFRSKYPAAVNSIINNSYMDDYLDSCSYYKEACDKVNHVIEINRAANFEMHGWASNYPSILANAHLENNDSNLIKMNSEVHAREKIFMFKMAK